MRFSPRAGDATIFKKIASSSQAKNRSCSRGFSPRALEKCYSNHDCELERIYSSTCTPNNSPSRSGISTHGRSLIDGAKNSFHCFVFPLATTAGLSNVSGFLVEFIF